MVSFDLLLAYLFNQILGLPHYWVDKNRVKPVLAKTCVAYTKVLSVQTQYQRK